LRKTVKGADWLLVVKEIVSSPGTRNYDQCHADPDPARAWLGRGRCDFFLSFFAELGHANVFLYHDI